MVNTDPTHPVLYGKRPKGGICFACTAQCIVIGTYNEDKNQRGGFCNTAVEKLADYLRSNGY